MNGKIIKNVLLKYLASKGDEYAKNELARQELIKTCRDSTYALGCGEYIDGAAADGAQIIRGMTIVTVRTSTIDNKVQKTETYGLVLDVERDKKKLQKAYILPLKECSEILPDQNTTYRRLPDKLLDNAIPYAVTYEELRNDIANRTYTHFAVSHMSLQPVSKDFLMKRLDDAKNLVNCRPFSPSEFDTIYDMVSGKIRT